MRSIFHAGPVGSIALSWFQLWPLGDVESRNEQYHGAELAPELLPFGSDDGGEMLAAARRLSFASSSRSCRSFRGSSTPSTRKMSPHSSHQSADVPDGLTRFRLLQREPISLSLFRLFSLRSDGVCSLASEEAF